jgi:hypothetical protein
MPRGVHERATAPRARTEQDDIEDGLHGDDPLGRDAARSAGVPYDEYLADARRAPADDYLPPGLIVPTNLTPSIDRTRPEDAPDLADGEWSKQHLLQFLARQPKDMVFIPKETWELKGEDTYQYVGLQGHSFRVVKNKAVMVPVQIAAIIKQSQEEFPTAQSRQHKNQLTDIRDLPTNPYSKGLPGAEVFLDR